MEKVNDQIRAPRRRDIEGIVRLSIACDTAYAIGVSCCIVKAIDDRRVLHPYLTGDLDISDDKAKQLCAALAACGLDVFGRRDDLPTEQQLEAHRARQGDGCPRCGKGAMTQGSSYDHDSGYVAQEMQCDRCELVWMDAYEYVGPSVIRDPRDGGWVDVP
jgi:hypothetical protein